MQNDPHTRAGHLAELLLPLARTGNAHAARAVYLLWTATDAEAMVDQLCGELVAYALAIRPVVEPWLGSNVDWGPRMLRDACAHAASWGRH